LEGAVRSFRRRTYRGLADFLGDVRFLVRNRSLVRQALRSGAISFSFRERLMMVVTEVNGCRYCSSFHSAQSLLAGVSADELRALLAGQIPEDSPAEELPALAYARHWAETNAHPDPDADRLLEASYPGETAGMIRIILRMIRAGNLLGNGWDHFLARASFGRLGLTARDAQASA
jgi:AhpD family alkylhydroperoxidase